MTIPPVVVVPPTLVTVAEFKQYARIETNAEDDLLGDLLDEVVGLIESHIGKSLQIEDLTIVDDARSWRAYEAARSLILPYMQIDPASIVVTDPEGILVQPEQYNVRLDIRQIVGLAVNSSEPAWGVYMLFGNGPYTIKCKAGYGTLPDYERKWLPRIRSLIKDYTLFLYQQRTPGASHEMSTGTTVDYGAIDPDSGLPYRVCSGLRKLRGIIC